MLVLRHKPTETTIATFDETTKQACIFDVLTLNILERYGISLTGAQAKSYKKTCINLTDKDFGIAFKEIYAARFYKGPDYEWVKKNECAE
jgi:hypothetical protein